MAEIFRLASYSFNPFAVPPLIVGSLVGLLGFGAVFWERASRISLIFLAMVLSAAVWLMGCGMMYLSADAGIALFWVRFYHVGVFFIPTFIFLFVLAMTRRLRYFWLAAAVGVGLSLFTVYFFLIRRLDLMVTELHVYPWGLYPRYHLWSLVYLVYFSGIVLFGFRLFQSSTALATGRTHERLKAFNDALAISILGIFDFAPTYGIPLYPFGYVWVLGFVILSANAIWQYRLREITSLFAANEILSTMQGAVVVVDSDRIIRVVNRSAAMLLGYSSQELIGKNAADIMKSSLNIDTFGAAGKEAVLRNQLIVGEGGRLYDYPMTWLRRGSEPVRVSVSASLLRDEDAQPQGIVYVALDISQRLVTEEALRQSEERLRLMIESVQDYALFFLDPEGMVVTWNEGAQRIKGYAAAEIIGRHFSCFYPVPDIEKGKPNDALEAAKQRGRYEMLGWQVRKDGAAYWAHVTLVALKDSKGNLRGFSSMTRDLTEKKQAEEIYRRFAAIFESTEDAVVTMAPNGKITTWNNAARRIYGYTASEAVNRTVFDLLPGEHRDEMLKILSRIAQGGRVDSYETVHLRKDGVHITVSLSVAPLADENGKIVEVSLIGRDISKAKKIEEALRYSEQRLRTIISTANEAFIEINQQGMITDWNKKAETLFGWSFHEAVGKMLHDTIIPERYRQGHRRGLSRYLLTGETKIMNERIEISALRRDGSEFPVELTVWPVKIGEEVTFNAFIQDITARHQAAEAMRERESLEIKSRFISMVSHELRTPLTAIKMGLDILTSGDAGEPLPAQKEWIEMAQRNVARLSHLINEVLEFQKLEAGRMQYDFKMHDLNEMLSELYKNTLLPLAMNKKLELKFFPGINLPLIMMDREKIAEVLMNLVNNAVKFTSQGSIEIHTQFKDDTAEISVKDSGIGIRKEDMPKLFHFFSQIRTETKARGTGLGLAISKKIVEQHGGSIEVFSEYGRGSTFTVRLPLAPAVPPQTAAKPI